MGQPNTYTRVGRATVIGMVAALTLGVSGCGILNGPAREIREINVSSSRLRDNTPLPSEYSCHGTKKSPPLRWSSDVLSRAKSIAVVVDDTGSANPAVHWVVYNIDPRTTELGEDASSDPPKEAGQAAVTSTKVGYEPPCEKTGSYRFSVYALSGRLEDTRSASLPDILKMIADQTIARGRLTAVHIE
ncbi:MULTISPECIES: YbhB/YbcL family Raf kinase inhibitor-like protein [Nonomuraea]|uniref:YbhB/YbcL family Raf kinase inhibitor-like protein n=1 Tax=Nonomuraea mangrovi TaxID=2316207 RepID=A0ABW4SW18_9ACTN